MTPTTTCNTGADLKTVTFIAKFLVGTCVWTKTKTKPGILAQGSYLKQKEIFE